MGIPQNASTSLTALCLHTTVTVSWISNSHKSLAVKGCSESLLQNGCCQVTSSHRLHGVLPADSNVWRPSAGLDPHSEWQPSSPLDRLAFEGFEIPREEVMLKLDWSFRREWNGGHVIQGLDSGPQQAISPKRKFMEIPKLIKIGWFRWFVIQKKLRPG